MCAWTSANVRPWPARHRRAPRRSTTSSEPQELARRVGRVAVVEVDRDAAEQVVAGDQQPPLGLVQADVRGRVARASRGPARSRGRSRSRRRAAGRGRARRSARCRSRRCAGAPRRRPAAAARGRRTGGAISSRRSSASSGSVGRVGHVPVVGVHPQLAARAVDDRGGLAVVVGVRVGADEQPHVLDLEVDLGERALEVGERAGLVHPGVEEDDAVAGGDRPGVAVRDAGPRQRQPQPPDAREDALAAADLALAGAGGHAAGDSRVRHGQGPPRAVKTTPPGRSRSATSRPSAPATSTRWCAVLGPGGPRVIRGQVGHHGARRRPRLLRRALRRDARLRPATSRTSRPRASGRPSAGARRARSPGPGRSTGVEPNGSRLTLEGCDVLVVTRRA